jgi:L-alanine-DL-glutamate epimerase-like enolase superfamily enzyme
MQASQNCEIRELKLKDPFGLSRGVKKTVRNLFLRIGEGWGEGAPIYYRGQSVEAMLKMAEEWFHSPHDLHRPIAEQVRVLFERFPSQSGLIQAFDLALHDAWGKREGRPLYELWGLDPKNAPFSSFTIGLDKKEIVLEKVRKAETYPILKIKTGGDNDLDLLAAIRNETQKPLLIDANEGWSCDQTLEYLPYLRELGVRLLEQPLPGHDREGYKRLCRFNPTGIPIFVDEAVQGPEDVEAWQGSVQGINVKLAKCGGLARALEMIRKARECGMLVMLGCMIESSLAITAAAHLAPLVDYADLDGADLIADDPFTGMKLQRGSMVLPKKNGIGAEPVCSTP